MAQDNNGAVPSILSKVSLFKGDKVLGVIIPILFIISTLVVYSSVAKMGYAHMGTQTNAIFTKHLVVISISLLTMLGFYFIPAKFLYKIAPLAYMRGRTLDDSFIILDEAQNTTREQMKMFLTRLGFGSKIVITGDITQIDLPSDKTSGLKDAVRVLQGVKDIAICRLTSADVVRHALVQEIINAYEKAASKNETKKPAPTGHNRGQRKY